MSASRPPVLGPGREFDRIRAIASALGDAARGLGDDCAEVLLGAGTPLISTDASVEEVHFRRAWLTPEEIGWRAASAALSDLAAMGAAAAGLVVAVVVPAGEPEATLTAVMRGVGSAATAAGAAVLGGDLVQGPSLALTVTVIGTAPRPVLRSGARPGDELWVTGALGGPRAALEAWLAGQEPSPAARARFAAPEARFAAGRELAGLGATAMIDLSDGLTADAAHLAAASGATVEIDLRRLPVHAAVVQTGDAAARYAAGSGEEYELLCTLPAALDEAAVSAALAGTGVTATRIGRVSEGPPAVRARLGETTVEIPGFDHFRTPPTSR